MFSHLTSLIMVSEPLHITNSGRTDFKCVIAIIVYVLCSLILDFSGNFLAELESTDLCNDGK